MVLVSPKRSQFNAFNDDFFSLEVRTNQTPLNAVKFSWKNCTHTRTHNSKVNTKSNATNLNWKSSLNQFVVVVVVAIFANAHPIHIDDCIVCCCWFLFLIVQDTNRFERRNTQQIIIYVHTKQRRQAEARSERARERAREEEKWKMVVAACLQTVTVVIVVIIHRQRKTLRGFTHKRYWNNRWVECIFIVKFSLCISFFRIAFVPL